MREVYLDHNATSPLAPEAREAMRPWLEGRFGNASSVHRAGRAAREAVERARAQVARLLGAPAEAIVFTGGGTEADNLALHGLAGRGDHVIVSAIEHPAVLRAAARLEASGCAVTLTPVDREGRVDVPAVRAALRPGRTRLLSVMAANNETGVLQPLEALSALAAEVGLRFHTDAVQAAGKVPLDVRALGCHALSISAHKLGGPQGVGALYLRPGVTPRPLVVGGGQERGLRAGTENVPGIVGLGAAAERALGWLAGPGPAALAARRDRLERGLVQALPRVSVNGAGAPRTPNTTNLSFDGVAARALVVALDDVGILASAGSACAAGGAEAPYVLVAMGCPAERAHAALRLSLGVETADEDVAAALERIPPVVERLRAMSPLWGARRAGEG